MEYNKLLAYQFTDNRGQVINETTSVTAVEKYLSTFIGVLTLVAFLYFTFQIITNGYAFLNSKGDPKNIQIAKDKLVNNILGIVIVVIAFGVVSLITNILGIGNIFDLKTVINNIN